VTLTLNYLQQVEEDLGSDSSSGRRVSLAELFPGLSIKRRFISLQMNKN